MTNEKTESINSLSQKAYFILLMITKNPIPKSIKQICNLCRYSEEEIKPYLKELRDKGLIKEEEVEKKELTIECDELPEVIIDDLKEHKQ